MSALPPNAKVWVTGSAGLIGSHVVRQAPVDFKARALTRSDADLGHLPDVRQLFESERPDAIVHCAAISRSPDCQADPALAHRENVEATRHLLDLAGPVPFVFLSTDLVFDGQKGGYTEMDATNPMSVYAETKLQAEELVAQNPHHIIVRTSLNGGPSPSGLRGIEEQMLNILRSGRMLNLFVDEYRCPIPAEHTAKAIWELMTAGASGIFHLAGAERLSRWQIGQCLAGQLPQFQSQIVQGTLRDYIGAPRSPDTSLDISKVQRRLSFPLPRFSEWIATRFEGGSNQK